MPEEISIGLEGKLQRQLDYPGVRGRRDGTEVARAVVRADATVQGSPTHCGWFQKGDAQLYVNRGIGTITFPIRIGARPEITICELTRQE